MATFLLLLSLGGIFGSALQMKGRLRIQYKYLVPIYVSPEMNCAASLFPKQNYNVLSPNFHIHVSVSDLYIPRIGLPILLQPKRQTDSGNIYCKSLADIHACRNSERDRTGSFLGIHKSDFRFSELPEGGVSRHTPFNL